MDKMLTLSLVVFSCSILVFFAKEFTDSFKKIMAIPGMKLLLPLTLMTFLIVYFEFEVIWILTKLQTILFTLTAKLASWLLFKWMENYLATLLVLMSLSFLPVLALSYWIKRKTYYPFKYTDFTITLIWLFTATLFTVGYHY